MKVTQLTAKVTEADLRAYFADAAVRGVRSVDLPRDGRTGRHRGAATVELEAAVDVSVCVFLSGAVPPFQKFPVQVAASATHELAPAASASAAAGAAAGTSDQSLSQTARLFVGRLPQSVDEAALLPVLSFYGTLQSLRLGEVGGHRHAFAVYTYEAAAAAAAAALQGFSLGGEVLQAELLLPAQTAATAAARDADLATRGAVALQPPVGGSASVFLEVAGLASPPTGQHAKEKEAYEASLLKLLEGECLKAEPVLEPVYYKLEAPAASARASDACALWEFDSAEAAGCAAALLHGRWLGGRRLRCAFLTELQFHARI